MTPKELPKELNELGVQALALHKARNFAEAEPLYLRMIAAAPDNPLPRHYLGILKAQTGRHADAADLLASALRLKPDAPDTLFHHAHVLRRLGRAAEALADCDRLLALRPDHAAGLNQRGSALQALKRYSEALASYDHALALKPDYGEAIYNRATVLHELDRYQEALAGYDAALAMAPRHAGALHRRGAVLHRLGQWEAALDSLDRALAARPDHADALRDRGRVLWAMHRIAEGFDSLRRITAQRDTEEDARLDGPAINPLHAGQAWPDSGPRILVLDDILTPPALEALRRLCRDSTVWRAAPEDGLAFAVPESGFAAPLLAQIAGELRAALPAVFQDHPLLHLEAARHDGDAEAAAPRREGAAVSVHLWLTPDDANRDPDHGGLLVWDTPVPEGGLVPFQGDAAMARKYLAAGGAQPITIPWRANRAVLLAAGLAQETDAIRFGDGPENRRASVTMRYGRASS
ncbi:MAG: hypothetical protein BGN82_10565 [Alphaproteobacteria bacterium 65-7]|nr:MAG: hypothetical protein BGN82_10565 [Alphaproteobacteria bacterium 65-7]